jgi:hypothetical protein
LLNEKHCTWYLEEAPPGRTASYFSGAYTAMQPCFSGRPKRTLHASPGDAWLGVAMGTKTWLFRLKAATE